MTPVRLRHSVSPFADADGNLPVPTGSLPPRKLRQRGVRSVTDEFIKDLGVRGEARRPIASRAMATSAEHVKKELAFMKMPRFPRWARRTGPALAKWVAQSIRIRSLPRIISKTVPAVKQINVMATKPHSETAGHPL